MALRNIGEYIFGADQLHLVRYATKVSPEKVLADYPKALAVMAAPMFGHTASGSCGGGLKPCTRQLDKSHGIDLMGASRLNASGVTISVVGGRASAARGNVVAPGATVAIQGYPTLAFGGQASGGGAESSVAGIGLLSSGRIMYLVASGGSLAELGTLFVQRGATAAGYCDAGSSAALYVRGEGYRGVHARNPTLPAWIIAEGGSGIVSAGGSKVIAACAGILVGSLALWWALKQA
jgi:hypothetical protein